jgi:predicted ArsR family transcriptional regulator
MTYFNTTGQSGDTLKEYKFKAESQEVRILGHFKRAGKQSPSQVWLALLGIGPLTSVRRAITNLQDAGTLTKTDLQRKGMYGRPEGIWELAA